MRVGKLDQEFVQFFFFKGEENSRQEQDILVELKLSMWILCVVFWLFRNALPFSFCYASLYSEPMFLIVSVLLSRMD